jgi:hypothetical protein
MLQWSGARFCLYFHQTDADRELYIGKLDKEHHEAQTEGGIVVSMKDDWRTIFPAEKK